MAKTAAFGITLAYDTPASPGSFVTVAQIKDITPPSMTAGTIDTTTHDSASAHREFVAGLIDAGEMGLELEFDDALADHLWMQTESISRTVHNWKITFPFEAPTTREFNGIITSFGITGEQEGSIMASASIKVTGVITVA